MKLRTLVVTVAVLAAASVAVFFLQRPAPPASADPRVGQPLVTDATLQETARFVLSDQGKTVTLARQADGTWRVPTYYDLPADFSKLSRLIDDLAAAKIQRAVTRNPERIARLEFKDTKLQLFDAAGKSLWSVTLGKHADSGGRFLRFDDQPAAYLASFSAWLDAEPKNWADSSLLKLKADDIAKVEIGFADGAPVVVSREKKEAPWTAAKTPDGQQDNPAKITSLLSSLDTLRFTDTTAPDDAKAVAARAHERTLALTTFAGETVTVALGREPEHDPAAYCGGRVLARHKQCDHHVGDFLIWDRRPIAVDAAHQIPDHILGMRFLGCACLLPTLADNIEVDLAHACVGGISLAIVWQRCPGKHEIYGREA